MEFSQMCLVLEKRPGNIWPNSIYPILGANKVTVECCSNNLGLELCKELARVFNNLNEDEVVRILADGEAMLVYDNNDAWSSSAVPNYNLSLTLTAIPHENGKLCYRVEKRMK